MHSNTSLFVGALLASNFLTGCFSTHGEISTPDLTSTIDPAPSLVVTSPKDGTLTIRPTTTPRPTRTHRPTATETSTPALIDGKWLLYSSSSMGFSFEYPALYEQPDYQEICGLHEYDNMVVVADQIVIWSEPANGRTAVQLANSMVDADQLSVEHREDSNSGDRVSASFRSAGSNAYGSFAVDTYGDALYVLAFYAGTLSCEAPDREMGRFVALAHISETWHKFEPEP